MAYIFGKNKHQRFMQSLSLLLIVVSIGAIGLHLLNPSHAATSTGVTLAMSPSSGTYNVGDTVNVTITENSGTTAITSVDAELAYTASTLQFNNASGDIVSGANFNEFSLPATVGNGTLSVTRFNNVQTNVPNAGLTGNQTVMTIKFMVIKAGAASIAFSPTSQVYALAGSTNVYSGTSTGAAYTVASAVVSPTPSPTVTPTPTPKPTTSPTPTPNPTVTPTPMPTTTPMPMSGGTTMGTTPTNASTGTGAMVMSAPLVTYSTKSSTGVSSAPLSVSTSNPITVTQPFKISPIINSTVSSNGMTNTVTKVEYLLNNKSLAVVTQPPFSYTVDTKHILNGSYTLVVKTTYQDGMTQSSSQKLVIKNPYNWSQISLAAKHYAWITAPTGIIILAGLGLVVAFLLRRPRYSFGSAAQTDDFSTYADPDIKPIVSSLPTGGSSEPTMSRIEPTVIAPSASSVEDAVATARPVVDIAPPAAQPQPRTIPVFSAPSDTPEPTMPAEPQAPEVPVASEPVVITPTVPPSDEVVSEPAAEESSDPKPE